MLTEQNPIYKAEVMMLYTFRTAMSVQRLGKANAMSVITVVMILVVLVPFLLRTYKETEGASMKRIENRYVLTVIYALLTIYALFSVIPFFWTTLQSFKTPRQATPACRFSSSSRQRTLHRSLAEDDPG